MVAVLAAAVVALVAATLLALRRSDTARRLAAAATTSLDVDDRQVRRTLADGRVESVLWNEIVEVEVITTRVGVHKEDGVLLVLGVDAERGCLVPSGLAAEHGVVDRLHRLPGFDVRALVAAMERPPPSRTTCWVRPPSAE